MGGTVITVLGEIGKVFLEAAPYVVIGLAAAALLYAVFPKEKIEKNLGRKGVRSTVKAAIFGIPLPLCSCGVVPTAMSLKDRGASRGATVAFLVSTPETGLDSIAITYALINPLMALLRPVSAFVTSVTAGMAVDRWGGDEKADTPQHNDCCVCGEDDCHARHGWRSRLAGSFRYIACDFFPDIANWLLLGLIVSGIVAALAPQNFLASVPSSAQLLLAVVVGIPLYICASASTPIAAVLMAKGVSPGAALVFLLVGPATNLASIFVVGRRLGPRTTSIYLGTLIVVSLLIGWVVNLTFGGWNWIPRIADPQVTERHGLFNWMGAVVLALGFFFVWWQMLKKRAKPSAVTVKSERHRESAVV